MFGSTYGMGELIVYSSNNNSDVTTLFKREGDQGDQWIPATVEVPTAGGLVVREEKDRLIFSKFCFFLAIYSDGTRVFFLCLLRQWKLFSIILLACKKCEAIEHLLNFTIVCPKLPSLFGDL